MMHDHPKRSCANCAFWQRSGARLANAKRDPSSGDDVGTCQIRAPELVATRNFAVSLFPETHATRVCGEWAGLPSGPDGDGGERIVAFPAANRLAA